MFHIYNVGSGINYSVNQRELNFSKKVYLSSRK